MSGRLELGEAKLSGLKALTASEQCVSVCHKNRQNERTRQPTMKCLCGHEQADHHTTGGDPNYYHCEKGDCCCTVYEASVTKTDYEYILREIHAGKKDILLRGDWIGVDTALDLCKAYEDSPGDEG
jgi:hypothetical protein